MTLTVADADRVLVPDIDAESVRDRDGDAREALADALAERDGERDALSERDAERDADRDGVWEPDAKALGDGSSDGQIARSN